MIDDHDYSQVAHNLAQLAHRRQQTIDAAQHTLVDVVHAVAIVIHRLYSEATQIIAPHGDTRDHQYRSLLEYADDLLDAIPDQPGAPT